jgi:hypothetical protein
MYMYWYQYQYLSDLQWACWPEDERVKSGEPVWIGLLHWGDIVASCYGTVLADIFLWPAFTCHFGTMNYISLETCVAA